MAHHGTVVITGASTGIGRATALRLARGGFDVLAGVRREEDGTALRAEDGRIEPVIVDVTDAGQVAALAARVGGAPLAGLVNNAGIAVAGPLEGIALDDVRQYEVNVFGLLAVTQALLQSIRAGHGRIVNIGSIGGRINTPFVGPYSSSKAAVRSLSAALRRELRPVGHPRRAGRARRAGHPDLAQGRGGCHRDHRRPARARAHPLRAPARSAARRDAHHRGGRELARRRRPRRGARAHGRAPEDRVHRRAPGPGPGRTALAAPRARLRRAGGPGDEVLALCGRRDRLAEAVLHPRLVVEQLGQVHRRGDVEQHPRGEEALKLQAVGAAELTHELVQLRVAAPDDLAHLVVAARRVALQLHEQQRAIGQ